jgi:hypothetical protein
MSVYVFLAKFTQLGIFFVKFRFLKKIKYGQLSLPDSQLAENVKDASSFFTFPYGIYTKNWLNYLMSQN